jgi:hypothetical protein
MGDGKALTFVEFRIAEFVESCKDFAVAILPAEVCPLRFASPRSVKLRFSLLFFAMPFAAVYLVLRESQQHFIPIRNESRLDELPNQPTAKDAALF